MTMNTRPGSRFLRALLLVPAAILLSARSAFADPNDALPFAIFGGFMIFFLLFLLAMYVYTALAVQTIAQKTNTENPWLAWIPIVNLLLLVMIAKKPVWWFFLFLIPLVNIVIVVMVWMAVAEARGKPSWWGIMTIVPVINLIVPGYLAWSD
jgi:hypothetical protein